MATGETVRKNILKSFKIQHNADGTFNHIEKGGKTGYYTDTAENRKFGRVGQKYSKEKTEDKEEEKKSGERLMNAAQKTMIGELWRASEKKGSSFDQFKIKLQGANFNFSEENWDKIKTHNAKKVREKWTLDEMKSLGEDVKSKLDVPWKSVQISTLGGEHNSTLMLSISLDKKEDWAHSILQNSRYAMFHIGNDGVIEKFSGHGKFRKAKYKDSSDLMNKLNKFIETHK